MTNYLDKPSKDQDIVSGYADLMGRVVQRNGKKFIYAKAAAALTAKTPYRVQWATGVAADNPKVGALTDGAFMNLIAIPSRTLASGDTDWFQVQGLCEDVILPSFDWVATHAFKVHDGAITTLAAVPTGANTEAGFIEARASTGAVALGDVFLIGNPALGTT